MRKILIFLLIILPFTTACDPESQYDFYIENSLSEYVDVTWKDGLSISHISNGKVMRAYAGKTQFIGQGHSTGTRNGQDFITNYPPGYYVVVFKVWVGEETEPLEVKTYPTDWRYRQVSAKDNYGEYTLILNQELIDKARKAAEEE